MSELDRLLKRFDKADARVTALERQLTILERAEVAGAVPNSTWANRPTTHLSPGTVHFFTDRTVPGGAEAGVAGLWNGTLWVGPDGDDVSGY